MNKNDYDNLKPYVIVPLALLKNPDLTQSDAIVYGYILLCCSKKG